MEHLSAPVIDMDVDDEDWMPTPAGHLHDTLGLAEQAARESSRAAAARMAAIAAAVEAGRNAPDVYVDELIPDCAEKRELVIRSVVLDLAIRLGLSKSVVRTLAHQADLLQQRLPRVWAAFARGDMPEQNTRIIAEHAIGLPREHDAAFDKVMADKGATLTPAKLRVQARTERERLLQETRQERHDRSAAERRTYIEAAPDGMAWFHWYGDAVAVLSAQTRIDAMAKNLAAAPDEARTLEQLRADVTADLLTGAGTPTAIKQTVFVTVPLLNLIGQRIDGVAPEAATLEGFGPIDDDTARRLFAQAPSYRRVGTDPISGIRLIMDRSTRKPTKDQKAWLRLQFRTCGAPGCNRAASECDIDHTLDWQYSGPTNDANLAPLCEDTHTLKTKTKLKVTRNRAGTLTVTTPTGASRDTDPPPF